MLAFAEFGDYFLLGGGGIVLALGMGFLGFTVLAAVLVAGAVLLGVAGVWAITDITVTKNMISFIRVSCFIYGDIAH